jgi:hypothetical protein
MQEALFPNRMGVIDRYTSNGWAMTPSGLCGVVNDAISLYFADATLAFVARWCVGSKVETAGGVFQVREDEPSARLGRVAPDTVRPCEPGAGTLSVGFAAETTGRALPRPLASAAEIASPTANARWSP